MYQVGVRHRQDRVRVRVRVRVRARVHLDRRQVHEVRFVAR